MTESAPESNSSATPASTSTSAPSTSSATKPPSTSAPVSPPQEVSTSMSLTEVKEVYTLHSAEPDSEGDIQVPVRRRPTGPTTQQWTINVNEAFQINGVPGTSTPGDPSAQQQNQEAVFATEAQAESFAVELIEVIEQQKAGLVAFQKASADAVKAIMPAATPVSTPGMP